MATILENLPDAAMTEVPPTAVGELWFLQHFMTDWTLVVLGKGLSELRLRRVGRGHFETPDKKNTIIHILMECNEYGCIFLYLFLWQQDIHMPGLHVDSIISCHQRIVNFVPSWPEYVLPCTYFLCKVHSGNEATSACAIIRFSFFYESLVQNMQSTYFSILASYLLLVYIAS